MTTDLTVKQAVSFSQSSVAVDMATLFAANNVSASGVAAINITPFGANQFLITVAYK